MTNKPNKKTPPRPNKTPTPPGTSNTKMCPACGAPYDEDDELWLHCEQCDAWSHMDCAGYSGWSEEDLAWEVYVCEICTL